MSDHAEMLRQIAKGDGEEDHDHAAAMRAGADAIELVIRLGLMEDLSHPFVLARALNLVATENSPGHNRQVASMRLVTAGATIAVAEGLRLDSWVDGAVKIFKDTRAAYNSPNRHIMREIAGMPLVEMEDPGVVVPLRERN